MNQITIFYDYVCPYCLLAKVPFEEAIKGKNVEITYIPYELTPEPNERIDIVNDPKRRKDWENLILPTSEKLGIGMKLPYVIPRPYTRMALEGAYFAREQKKEREYHDRIFRAFFVEGQDIGEIDVLVTLATEAGLDAEAYREAVLDRRFKEIREKDVRYAKEVAKVTSIPTYVINGERISGEYEKEAYEKLLR